MRFSVSLKRWLKILAVMLIVTIGPTSCFFFVGSGCPDTMPYFQVTGLSIYNAVYTGVGLNPWRIINTNEAVKYDKYFMRIEFEKSFVSQNRIGGGQNLFATSCAEPGFAGSKVGVDTIYLISQQDYNNHYLKGDTINTMVLTNYWTYTEQDFSKFFPLTQYIRDNREKIENGFFEMKVTEPPLNEGNFDFKLIFILKNGERFDKVSDKVILTK